MKKEYIFIICIIVILTIFIIVMKTKVNKTNTKDEANQNTVVEKSQIEYDENTGYYYVRDTKTGEIRGASQDEAELKIYIDNPDYDPDPSTTNPTDLDEYIETTELEIID